jgi:hypothetical protein
MFSGRRFIGISPAWISGRANGILLPALKSRPAPAGLFVCDNKARLRQSLHVDIQSRKLAAPWVDQ